jgi:hypothetical protein
MVTTVLACALILAPASCGSDEGDDPGDEIPEDAVLITQGTSPTVEGLAIGLSSVSGDEARMLIAQPEEQAEPFRASAGETIEVGEYTVEIFDVESNDEGGSVRLKVTPP